MGEKLPLAPRSGVVEQPFYAADFVKLDDQAWNGELRS